jgi:hypothetical protein
MEFPRTVAEPLRIAALVAAGAPLERLDAAVGCLSDPQRDYLRFLPAIPGACHAVRP